MSKNLKIYCISSPKCKQTLQDSAALKEIIIHQCLGKEGCCHSPAWPSLLHLSQVHSAPRTGRDLLCWPFPPSRAQTRTSQRALNSPWNSWQSDCAASAGLGHVGSSRRSPCDSAGIVLCCGWSSQTSRSIHTGERKIKKVLDRDEKNKWQCKI